MVDAILQKIKLRIILVFLTLHLGLVFAVYGLAAASREVTLGSTYWYILIGIFLLYGGALMGALFVFLPVYSVSKKIRKLLNWREWILKELPQMISLIPSVVSGFKEAMQKLENAAANEKTDQSES